MNTQVLRNSGERILVTFSFDGTPTDPDTAAASVTITRDSDGTAVATAAATTRISAGVFTYTLAEQTALDKLTAVWSAQFSGSDASVTTYVDIVGGYLCSLADLRAMKNLENTSTVTTAKLVEARQWFETLAEEYCGQAFVPRYKRQRFSGNDTPSIMLDPNVRTIRSVKDYTSGTAFTSFTSDQLADLDIDPVGTVSRLTGGVWRFGRRNLEIVYEHGMDSCPNDLREAAKNAIRLKVLDDTTGHREYAVQTDVGLVRYGTPGQGRPTGEAIVDSVLNRYRMVPVG